MKFFRHIATLVLISTISISINANENTPEVIKFLEQQGAVVVDTFDSEAGLTGYAVTVDGQALSIYVTPDKKYALVGNLIDAKGNNLGTDALKRLITGPAGDKAWLQVVDSNWVADGKNSAKRIVYTFTDPNCPYCQKLRAEAATDIANGNVQFRHIMVGVISATSPSQAANILGADNPAEVLLQHHKMLGKGGVEQNQKAIKKGNAAVRENTQLMQALGYSGTPISFYKDENGEIVILQGFPRGEALERMLDRL